MKLFAEHRTAALKEFPHLTGRRLIHETVRRMIDAQVTDLLAETRARIARLGIAILDDVAVAPPLVAFSPAMHEMNRELKHFLHTSLYRHYQVVRMTTKARRIVKELFSAFLSDMRLLPEKYRALGEREGEPRAIADYIAGMTDRYAIKEHRRLFAVGEL